MLFPFYKQILYLRFCHSSQTLRNCTKRLSQHTLTPCFLCFGLSFSVLDPIFLTRMIANADLMECSCPKQFVREYKGAAGREKYSSYRSVSTHQCTHQSTHQHRCTHPADSLISAVPACPPRYSQWAQCSVLLVLCVDVEIQDTVSALTSDSVVKGARSMENGGKLLHIPHAGEKE